MQFETISGDVLRPVAGLVILGIMVISVVGITQWRKLRQAAMETALKHQMLEQGMSAEEIALVLSASASKESKDQPAARRRIREMSEYKG